MLSAAAHSLHASYLKGACMDRPCCFSVDARQNPVAVFGRPIYVSRLPFIITKRPGRMTVVRSILLGAVFLSVFVTSSYGAKGDTEYCQRETFKANCRQPDEVIVMQRAKYGRMQYGRCIKRNYGYVGCDVDVLSFADMRCSGKRTCAVNVPNKYLDNTKPCPEDLKMYLEAEYTCINVTRPKHAKCEDREPVEVKGTTGILSSAITKDTGCGSTTTPWVIRAEPGQRISFRLTDFGLLGRNETGGSRQMHQHCQVYAIIKDGHTGQGTTICGGDPSQPKERHVYMSKGNYVEVRIIVRRTAADFLLKFEAMGCSDLQVPANSWTKRQGTEVEVGCEGSKESWKMTCKNGTWVGDMAPCVDTAATGSDKQKRAARLTQASPRFPRRWKTTANPLADMTSPEWTPLTNQLTTCEGSGEFILTSHVCDGHVDCSSGSDESANCLLFAVGSRQECSVDQFRCGDGACLSLTRYCNGIKDCADGSDEECYLPACFAGPFCVSATDGYLCVPNSRCDSIRQCLKTNAQQCQQGEKTGKFIGGVNRKRVHQCTALIVNNNTQQCDDVRCDDEGLYFHCTDDVCIPRDQWCDGITQCADGVDEVDCGWTNCTGAFQCHKSNKCFGLSQVCDGVVDCPFGDDEARCDFRCPSDCACAELTINCSRGMRTELQTKLLSSSTRYLDVSYNKLRSLLLEAWTFLHTLNLSHNAIGPETLLLYGLYNVQFLDISYNEIGVLTSQMFNTLFSLKEVNLEGNNIIGRAESLFPGDPLVFVDKTMAACCVFKQERTNGCSELKHDVISSCEKMIKYDNLAIALLISSGTSQLMNVAYLIMVIRRESKSRLLLAINMPLSCMFLAMFPLLLVVGSQSYSISYAEPNLTVPDDWIDCALCRFLPHLLLAAATFFCTSICSNAVLTFLVPPTPKHIDYYTIPQEPSVFDLTPLVALLNFLFVWLPPVVVSSVVKHDNFYSEADELCNPIRSLLLPVDEHSGDELTDGQQNAAKNFKIFLRTIFVGVNLGTFVGVTLLGAVSAVLGLVRQRSQDQPTVFDHLGIQRTFSRSDSRVERQRSRYRSFIVACDGLTCLAVGILVEGARCDGWFSLMSTETYAWFACFVIPAPCIIHPLSVTLMELYSAFWSEEEDEDEVYFRHRKRRKARLLQSSAFSRLRSRRYQTMTKFLNSGRKLSPVDIFNISDTITWNVNNLHKDGLVCDVISCDFVVLGVERERITEAEFVASTEYPKSDVHEWRKQRDVHLLGQLIEIALANTIPAPVRDTSTMKTRQKSRRGLKNILSFKKKATFISANSAPSLPPNI